MKVRPPGFVMARTEFLRPQRRVVAQRVGMDDQGEVAERKSLAVAVLRDRSSECRGERSGVARAPCLVDVDVVRSHPVEHLAALASRLLTTRLQGGESGAQQMARVAGGQPWQVDQHRVALAQFA